MSPPVTIIDGGGLAGFPWPDSEDGRYARAYLSPVMTLGPAYFIRNIYNTQVMLARAGDVLLPLTLSDFHPANSYTVSPYNHYIAYGGLEESHKLGSPLAGAAARALISPLGAYLRAAEFDRVVFVNNWLLSTNLYPQITAPAVRALVKALPERFPERAIIFRSVDAYANPLLHQTLLECGCHMVMSRQVYYQHPPEALRKKQVKVDVGRLRRSPYRLQAVAQGLSAAEAERAVELYNLLYIEKYSAFNPQFTPAFVRLAAAEGLLHLRFFELEGRIDAVLGYFTRRGVMTQPFFGYDTHLPQETRLYTLLSAQTVLEGAERGLLINASAGVGPFKRLRGGLPVSEYNAVYDAHLPPRRRRAWRLLGALMQHIAEPLFKKYGF